VVLLASTGGRLRLRLRSRSGRRGRGGVGVGALHPRTRARGCHRVRALPRLPRPLRVLLQLRIRREVVL
jgi:hypothetical protein